MSCVVPLLQVHFKHKVEDGDAEGSHETDPDRARRVSSNGKAAMPSDGLQLASFKDHNAGSENNSCAAAGLPHLVTVRASEGLEFQSLVPSPESPVLGAKQRTSTTSQASTSSAGRAEQQCKPLFDPGEEPGSSLRGRHVSIASSTRHESIASSAGESLLNPLKTPEGSQTSTPKASENSTKEDPA